MTINNNADVVAIVPAAGIGERLAAGYPKQYIKVAGRSILEHSLRAVTAHQRVAAVVVVLAADDPYFPALKLNLPCPLTTVVGGQERAQSVIAGLQQAAALSLPWALVHDAARPCLRKEDLERLLHEGCRPRGALLAVPVRDTIKQAGASAEVMNTVDRSRLWHAQTPQLFATQTLLQVMQQALAAGVALTDEASAMEWAGYHPKLVCGHADNLKVTLPEDIALAEYYLAQGGRI